MTSLLLLNLCLSSLVGAKGHTFEVEAIKIKDAGRMDQLGSVVTSAGNKLLIGAPYSNNALGRVLIYERANHDADFELHGEYYGRSANEHFGAALSMLGDMLIVGSPHRICYLNNVPLPKCGCVHVFMNTEGKNMTSIEWAKHTIQSDILNAYNLFGASVASGKTVIAVGSPGYNGYVGHVGIYRINDESWAKVSDLAPLNNFLYAKFGSALAMYGRFLAVSCVGDTIDGATESGSVQMFSTDETETTWVFNAVIAASDPVDSGAFGSSLAIYENVLAVGSKHAPGHSDYTGAVYLFEHSEDNGFWVQMETLIAHDGSLGDEFGCSVGLYQDTIAVGACGENGKMVNNRAWQISDGEKCGEYSVGCVEYQGEFTERGEGAGALYIYSYDTVMNEEYSKWQEVQKVLPDKSDEQWQFGVSVSVNGDTVLVGASGATGADGVTPKVGAVYEVKVDWLYYRNALSNMGSVIKGIIVVATIIAVPLVIYIGFMIRGSDESACDYVNNKFNDLSSKLVISHSNPSKDVTIRSTHGLLEEVSSQSTTIDNEMELPPTSPGASNDPKLISDWGISRPTRKKPIHK